MTSETPSQRKPSWTLILLPGVICACLGALALAAPAALADTQAADVARPAARPATAAMAVVGAGEPRSPAGTAPAAPAVSLPNLTPHRAAGWTAPIVVSTTDGITDTYPLLPSDTIYVRWRVINAGDAEVPAEPNCYYNLYLDDGLVATLPWNIALPPGWEAGSPPATSLGSLPAGLHTLRIVADATEVVAESDETDNSYTKTIWVGNAGWEYLEDFEATPAGWDGFGLWHLATSCSASLPGHSTPRTSYFGVDASCTYDTGGWAFGDLYTETAIDLTSAPGNLSLVFRYLLETENWPPEFGVFDKALVYYSIDDGSTWSMLDRDATNGGTLDDDGFWSTAVYDVSSWAGHSVLLYFEFDSVDEGMNDFEGWHVDDVGFYALGSKWSRSLLWTQNGLAMAWTITGAGAFGGMQGFGTDSNWRATSYQPEPDGSANLLWTDQTAGTAMVWHLTPAGHWGTMEGFGLAPGWKATAYGRNADRSAYLLWTDGNGSAQTWTILSDGSWGGSQGYWAGEGWVATGGWRNIDGTGQLVWANPTTGQAMVWSLTVEGGWGGMIGLGIGPGWVANGYQRNPDGSGVLLWANSGTGQAMAWKLTEAGAFAGMQGFGVSTGWEAASYLRKD